MDWPLAYAPFATVVVEEGSQESHEGTPAQQETVRTEVPSASCSPPPEQQARGNATMSSTHRGLVLSTSISSTPTAAHTAEGAFHRASHTTAATAETQSEAGPSHCLAGGGGESATTPTSTREPRRVLRLSLTATAANSTTEVQEQDASVPASRRRGRPPLSVPENASVTVKAAKEAVQTAVKRAQETNTRAATPEEAAAEQRRLLLASARPASLAECFDWWTYFCYHDTHALFTSQSLFDCTLRPLAAASASRFYAAMNRCFRVWRQQHWETHVVMRRGGAASTASSSSRVVRDPAQLEYANAVWYEALRVQRLVAQHLLLLSCSASSPSGVQAGEWFFPEACPLAFAAALGDVAEEEEGKGESTGRLESAATLGEETLTAAYAVRPVVAPYVTSSSSSSTTAAAREGVHSGAASVQAAVSLKQSGSTNPLLPFPTLVVSVPTASRVLLLLRVVDALWADTPASLPFRLPVSEMEAPHYYRGIKDPMSLCHLYDEVFTGMTAASLRACVKCRKQRSHTVTAALSSDRNSNNSSNSAEQKKLLDDVQACFLDYAQLRERLTLLKANCDNYNGAGSDLSRRAHQLMGTGTKMLRDAVAEEDGRAAYLKSMQAQTPQQRDALFMTVDDAAGAPHCLVALSVDELSESALFFPPSAPAAVVPPSSRVAQDTDAAAAAVAVDAATRQLSDAASQGKATAGASGLSGAPRRVLQLPAAAAAAATRVAPVDFWVQCDDCRSWHRLATRLDPVPETWTCSELGLPCTAAAGTNTQKKRRGRPPKAAGKFAEERAVHKAERKEGGRRKTRSKRTKSGQDGSVVDSDDETPLAALFPVDAAMMEALKKEDAAAQAARKQQKRKRQRRQRGAKAVKKARTVLADAPPSSSDSPSSSSSSSSSSGSSDSSSNSSSSSSSSSSGDGDSDTASSAARRVPAQSRKQTRKASTKKSARRSRASAAALTQLQQAVEALERRRLEDDPFAQLEEVKRLEKLLGALS